MFMQQHMVARQLLSKYARNLAQDHFVEGADGVCGVEGEGHTVVGVVTIIPAGLPVGDVDAGCVRQDAHVPVLGSGGPGLVPLQALLDQAPLQSRPGAAAAVKSARIPVDLIFLVLQKGEVASLASSPGDVDTLVIVISALCSASCLVIQICLG